MCPKLQAFGLNGENFSFCDVGNGQWDGVEYCQDGTTDCVDASELYTDSEKEYGALLVSYENGLDDPIVFESISKHKHF